MTAPGPSPAGADAAALATDPTLVDSALVSQFEVAVVTAEGAQPVTLKPEAPQIRIVKGSPTDAEVAAIVAVIAAAGSSTSESPDSQRPREDWGDPAVRLRGHTAFSPESFVNLVHRRF